MVAHDRAISTVMDVALALLIISASVLAVGLYLHSDDGTIDGDRGDEALQTLSGSTITITYDLSSQNESGYAANEDENYELPDRLDPEEVSELYEVTTYGSAIDMLGEATLTNLQIDGAEMFAYGYDVERSVDAAIRGRLIGSEGTVYVVATWEPYNGAGIDGAATVGDRPPQSVDTSSSTTKISSNVHDVDSSSLAQSFIDGEEHAASRSGIDDGFDTVGVEIADAIIAGYFPERQTQYTLESTLTENAVTVYNYRQLADVSDVDIDDHITGSEPSAAIANEELRGGAGDDDGLAAVIADDMRDSAAGEEIRETYDEFGDAPSLTEQAQRQTALVETFDDVVSTGTIDITVQTWN